MQVRVVLYNIRSIHNVGSVFRTADAAGVEKIYCAGITPSPLDRFGKIRPEMAKVALGAEHTVPWDGSTSSPQVRTLRGTLRLIQQFKKEGYVICAVEQSTHSIPYHQIKKLRSKKKIAIILGSETKGLPSSILKSADYILEIPMRGTKESLNVSVAAGIVLFRLRYP